MKWAHDSEYQTDDRKRWNKEKKNEFKETATWNNSAHYHFQGVRQRHLYITTEHTNAFDLRESFLIVIWIRFFFFIRSIRTRFKSLIVIHLKAYLFLTSLGKLPCCCYFIFIFSLLQCKIFVSIVFNVTAIPCRNVF